MPDYSKHRMQNWEWYAEYRSRMGIEAFDKYVNSVYNLLMKMKPGAYFVIERNVKPENIDLFIKICCMFIREQSLSDLKNDIYHNFNADYSKIVCTN